MLGLSKDEEERAKLIHNRCLVVDGHSDLMLDVDERRSCGEKHVIDRVHIPKLREGGVKVAVIAVSCDAYTWDSTENALESIGNIYSELEESPEAFLVATKAAEIKTAVSNNKVAFILHMEGGRPIKQDIGLLRVFYRLGVRSMGLTWHWRNFIADGAKEPTNCGLSLWGREVIKEMNNLGMIIDVAHVAKQSILDTLEISKDPIIDSHACCLSLCSHPRNLDDETIEAIAKSGGVIGLLFFSEYIDKEKPTLDRLVDHVDHIVELVGIDHVGLGPDFIDYFSKKRYAQLLKKPVEKKYLKDLENVTKMPNITRALVKRGYSDKEIEKILGLNFFKVYERILH